MKQDIKKGITRVACGGGLGSSTVALLMERLLIWELFIPHYWISQQSHPVLEEDQGGSRGLSVFSPCWNLEVDSNTSEGMV